MPLKHNLIYSALLTLSTYLVPLLVFPYISRVLGAEGIGIVDAVDGVIDYCIFFAQLGITTIGVREIAQAKGNPVQLSKTFSSLFALHVVTMAIVCLILFIAVVSIPHLQNRWQMFAIGSLKLIANLFWIEWFYKGMENFRYITIRSIIVRLLFIVSVFLLIRTADDYPIYYALFAGITIINAICNWTYRRRFCPFSLGDVNIRKIARPCIILGIFAVLSSIYTKLSTPLLSYLCGDHEAGLFATGTRMYQVIISLVSALTAVMIPRMSVLVKEGDMVQVRQYTFKAFRLLFALGFMMILFIELAAPWIIHLFAGDGFDGAVLPMRIIIWQVLIIGSEQILILQLLIPMGKDRTVALCGVAGVITWAIGSFTIVPQMGAVGSAIVWCMAEIAVLIAASAALIHILRTEGIQLKENK